MPRHEGWKSRTPTTREQDRMLAAAAPDMLVLLREAWNRGTAPLPEEWIEG